jgi:hypothetical protein
MRFLRNTFVAVALSFLSTGNGCSQLFAQSAPASSIDSTTSLPRVFLDCRAPGCDSDFFRTELAWMSFVRDRNEALVHVIATSRSTSSGGSEVTLTFEPQDTTAGAGDSIVTYVQEGASSDGARRVLSKAIAQGMVRYVHDPALLALLTISYKPTNAAVKSDTRGSRDPWHLWVIRISTGGYLSGDANYAVSSLNASLRASRITQRWKASLSFSGNYRQNSYVLSDTETLKTYLHGYDSEGSLVKSVSARWSVGAQSFVSSSVQLNEDLALSVGPAVEFDVFPYAQSTRKQVVFRYGPGVSYTKYHDITIYDKLKETHPNHQLLVAAQLTQPWGSVSASSTFRQLLDEPDKSNLNVNAYVSWRVATGLNLNVGGGYTRIRDQLSLRLGTQESQDVLLQLRQLRTGYSYYGNVGLSFTFGSIFQNVVNPRFSQGQGGSND